ncbi:MAG: beta-ketoacyl-[acyl-carrier-protein] synthase family protein [Deltaproteobacteria bacterium]|nr:beta-ketoacyl-[acyl-carrier-protein] synthase family protein [Deltaproteobacteria bacterium]
MTGERVYITGMGLVTSAGCGVSKARGVIRSGETRIRPLSLFPVSRNNRLPVGEVGEFLESGGVPRTHQLALTAAREAMAGCKDIPDAVVMGVTTGGMLTTEQYLQTGDGDPDAFKYHSPSSVSEYIAHELGCHGPVITLSTACSSGAVAIKIALDMLRAGRAGTVLAGGADSLSRLTYHGFRALQLIDPQGARPFDKDREGMSVAEGAAVLVLTASESVPDNAIAEILGAGLSCDAYHPSASHPDGAGAIQAMQAAVRDAHISLEEIDYINLHGTGTVDNDRSEARALNTLFPDKKPLMSSVKGAFGHSLGAAGAMEAVVSALAVSEGLVPANVGCHLPDPELTLAPLMTPSKTAHIHTVLSNSFGFGGNNASVVIGSPRRGHPPRPMPVKAASHLLVLGSACLTGAGDTGMSLRAVSGGKSCRGRVPDPVLSQGFSPRDVRRLRRLPRLVLSLASAAHADSRQADAPGSIFFGTGWGALSETYDFLTKLFESGEQFPSPIDFIGSVHNAPAGQAAIRFGSMGPNITATGGDYSFEQALMLAGLMAEDSDDTLLVVGSDEFHDTLSRLFDRSTRSDATPSEGGGAMCLKRSESDGGLKTAAMFYETSKNNPSVISSLMVGLAGREGVRKKYGAVFAGIPAACRKTGEAQLREFLSMSGFEGPVIDYRRVTGEFASASAVAAVLALQCVDQGELPGGLHGGKAIDLKDKGILLVGLGDFVTAIEVIH